MSASSTNPRVAMVSSGRSKQFKILKMGLFTCQVIPEQHTEKDDTIFKGIKSKVKKRRRLNLSFFKAVDLYVDYIRRSRVHSLKHFLSNIYIDKEDFSEIRKDSEYFFEHTSVELRVFVSKYLEHCTKHGFKYVDVETQADTFKSFNLQIVSKENSATSAYLKIRWKSLQEKIKSEIHGNPEEQKVKNEQESEEEERNSIEDFLNSECVPSEYKTDYILSSQLVERYELYCNAKGIDKLNRNNITGAPELETFGAEFQEYFQVAYVSGVVLKMPPSEVRDKYTPGLVRMPIEDEDENEDKKIKESWFSKLIRNTSSLFTDEKGLTLNALSVILSLLIIFGIPLLFFLAVTWSLLQIDIINGDIYDPVYDMNDFFSSSYYSFWWSHISYGWVLYIFGGLSIIFIIIGLAELVWYFATAERDTGKYIVSKTLPRWIVSGMFWIVIIFYVALYIGYFSIILIWSILGAILNPEKFLPIATGAAVIIGFLLLMYSKLSNLNKSLLEVVSLTINDQLHFSFLETFGVNKSDLSKGLDEVDSLPKVLFNKATNAYMSANDHPQVERAITDQILDGNVGALATILHKHLGIDYAVCLALIGALKNDPVIIWDSVHRLSEQFGLDPVLNVTLTELVLDQFKSDISSKKKKLSHEVVQAIKKLIRHFFPEFPWEVIDWVIQFVTQRDPAVFKGIFRNFNISPELIDFFIAISSQDSKKIYTALMNIPSEIIPDAFKKIATLLYWLSKGHIQQHIEEISKLLEIKSITKLNYYVALLHKNESATRELLYNTLLTVSEEVKNEDEDKVEAAKVLENIFLCLNTFSQDDSVNISALATDSEITVNTENLSKLQKASEGNFHNFKFVLERLGLERHSNIVEEFLNLLQRSDSEIVDISARLGVPKDAYLMISSLFKLIIESKLYSIQACKLLSDSSSTEKTKFDKIKQNFKEKMSSHIFMLPISK